MNEYPFYMDIPITGEFIFSCDRRIWQGKLFEDYVYRGFGEDLCIFRISQIRKRISKDKMIIHFDKQKSYRTTVVIDRQEKEISLTYDVIKRYLEYLDLLGFVSHAYYEWYSRRPVSMDPPNRITAGILEEVIDSADLSSPDIDAIIKNELIKRLPLEEQEKVLAWDKQLC